MAKEQESKETAAPPSGDTGDKTYSKTEVDALVATETEKRKEAERASTKHSERVKALETSQGNWQSDIQNLRTELTQGMQLMAGLAVDGRPPEDAETLTPGEKGDAIKRTQALIADNETKRKQTEYNNKANALWTRAQNLGLPLDSDEIDDIQDLLERGRFDRAERKTSKLESARKEAPPKETDEDRQSAAETRAMEIVKEKFPDALLTETGGPSASSLSARDAKQAYIKGEITAEQAKERGANFD